ncbi:MAG: hypothetical protein ACYCOU_12765 [Sulfobacillus sp.]
MQFETEMDEAYVISNQRTRYFPRAHLLLHAFSVFLFMVLVIVVIVVASYVGNLAATVSAGVNSIAADFHQAVAGVTSASLDFHQAVASVTSVSLDFHQVVENVNLDVGQLTNNLTTVFGLLENLLSRLLEIRLP